MVWLVEHHEGLAEDENGHGHDQSEEKVQGKCVVSGKGAYNSAVFVVVLDLLLLDCGRDGGFHEPVDEAY